MTIKKFRPYVKMMPFTVVSDHGNLKWLMTLKDLRGRISRWSPQLQAYNFKIIHRKGADNVVADVLSRVPWIDEITKEELSDFPESEFQCQKYLDLVRSIEENAARLPDLKVDDGKIFKRMSFNRDIEDPYLLKLWIPSNLTHSIIEKDLKV